MTSFRTAQPEEAPTLSKSRRSMRYALAAWSAILTLFVLITLQIPLYHWIHNRASRGGEGAVPSILWLITDCLLPVWAASPHILFILLIISTWATWGLIRRRPRSLHSTAAWSIAITVAVVSSVGVILLSLNFLSSFLTWGCEPTAFESVTSPNGRYEASVVEIDCGAMSSSNRQVLLTRRPFRWTSMSIFYFHGNPSLHLAWSGRTLTLTGDRNPSTMDRPPPDPILYGGILARYTVRSR